MSTILTRKKKGLWENIRNKKERRAKGSGETKSQKGDDDYPTEKAMKQAQKSSKQNKEK